MNRGSGAVRGSLRVRMLLSATLVLVVFLGVLGVVVDNAFRQSAGQAVSERLQLHIYALIAASVEDDKGGAVDLYLPTELQEPGFNAMGSGLFGVVFTPNGKEIWRSVSALELELGAPEKDVLLAEDTAGIVTFSELLPAAGHGSLFYLTYPVIWESGLGDARFVYVVLQDFEPYSNEVATFRESLWGWLIAAVVVLVGLQAAIMYWGLLPIAGLEHDLKAIEEGRQEYLVGQYPTEINGVTRSLNLLLSEERAQRERYRTTLADLAHSLKTPLAILKAEAEKPEQMLGEVAAALDQQVTRMTDIVSYQLERAVSSSSKLFRSSTPIRPVTAKLMTALTKVYKEKNVAFLQEVSDVDFPGDERDLMELLGNLLDNACKYGQGKVRLAAEVAAGRVRLSVEDNGFGIPESDRGRVLERGLRLDSREPGQGIGLAIVAEIVDRYNGEIEIVNSSLGGARVIASFPLAWTETV
ncbi:MAG: ATP-binding protein [Candidatus Azotimanducaceae bacterium WSBS_2022_MAG_OTU7]